MARLILMALDTPVKLPLDKMISPVSMATSVPVPMAIPTSAWARAGASLIPSPTMPVFSPFSWSSLTLKDFSSGWTSAKISSMLTSEAMAWAV